MMANTVGKQRRWLRRGIPILIVVVIAGGVFGTRAFADSSDSPSYRLARVTTGSIAQTLTLNGTAQQATQSTSTFRVSGTVKSVPVAIGDHVSSGQTVATLDPTTLQNAVVSAKATLAQAKATLDSDENGTSSSSGSSATNAGYDTFTTTSAEVFAVDTAVVTVASTPPPTTPAGAAAAVAKQQVAVSKAAAAATAALAAVTGAQKTQDADCQSVTGSGATPTPAQITTCVSDIETTTGLQAKATQAQTDLTTAQKALGAALTNQAKVLAKVSSGSSSGGSGSSGTGSTSGSGRSSSGSGSSGGSGSSSSGGSSSGGGQSSAASAQRIASDKAQVTTAQSALTTAESNLAAATLTAPISGTVAALSYVAGDASSTGSITIVGAGAVDVTVDVPLASLPQVKVGQQASVTAAGSSTAMPGTVRSISLLPASSTSTTVTYPVVVRVPRPSASLAGGSSATATITLGSVKNVVTVPNSALTSLVSGTGFVQTVKNGKVTQTIVRTGAVGATSTQVTSGLTAGQQVVIANLSEALPTTTTTNRFATRTGTGGLTSSLSGAGGLGGGATFGGGGFGGGGFNRGG
jgi:multidrug efflux pump subunit AcrA (membrane-fusion protein)